MRSLHACALVVLAGCQEAAPPKAGPDAPSPPSSSPASLPATVATTASSPEPSPPAPPAATYTIVRTAPDCEVAEGASCHNATCPPGFLCTGRPMMACWRGVCSGPRPKCLAGATRIDTPTGPVAVARLAPGALVYTRDAHGSRVVAPIAAVGSTPAPADHRLVHVWLADGRSVAASPQHPTSTGQLFDVLTVGAVLDGSTVVRVAREPFSGDATYDLRPEGATGDYWADGVLIGSTLRPDEQGCGAATASNPGRRRP